MDQFNQAPAPLAKSMGDEYDATASYAVGELCIHGNKLMRCTTAIATGGEAWNASHWTETNIADEIDRLNDKIIPQLKPTTRTNVLSALNTNYSVPKDAWFRVALEANGTSEMKFLVDGQLIFSSKYNGMESHLVPLAKDSIVRFESTNDLPIGSTTLQILM